MTEEVKNVSSVPEQSGGQSQEMVSYETHRKLLGQRKQDQERVRELESRIAAFTQKEQEAKEKALAEQGEFKKLLDLSRQENEKLKSEKEKYANEILSAHKLNAFREKLPGNITNSAYYSFVDLDDIVIDPDSGTVDMGSVENAVNKFMGEHSSLVKPKETKGLPNHAPKDNLGAKPIGKMNAIEKSAVMQEAIKSLMANSKR